MGDIIAWILGNWQAVIGALGALAGALVALLLIIPGNQGEAAIQKFADVLKKIAGFGVK